MKSRHFTGDINSNKKEREDTSALKRNRHDEAIGLRLPYLSREQYPR